MLLAEYDYETDIAVQRQENLMIGIEQGAFQTKLETARLMKEAHCETDFIMRLIMERCKERGTIEFLYIANPYGSVLFLIIL